MPPIADSNPASVLVRNSPVFYGEETARIPHEVNDLSHRFVASNSFNLPAGCPIRHAIFLETVASQPPWPGKVSAKSVKNVELPLLMPAYLLPLQGRIPDFAPLQARSFIC
jgi:hypothetical protein